jgi:hypothetical protein
LLAPIFLNKNRQNTSHRQPTAGAGAGGHASDYFLIIAQCLITQVPVPVLPLPGVVGNFPYVPDLECQFTVGVGIERPGAKPLDDGKHILGQFGSAEGLWIGVPAIDESVDR